MLWGRGYYRQQICQNEEELYGGQDKPDASLHILTHSHECQQFQL